MEQVRIFKIKNRNKRNLFRRGRDDRIQPLRVLLACPPKRYAFRYRTAHLFAKKQSAGLFLLTQKPSQGSNPLNQKKKQAIPNGITCFLVGMTGFEPAALWSQTRCATKLRYIPKTFTLYHKQNEKAIEILWIYILLKKKAETFKIRHDSHIFLLFLSLWSV